LLYNALIKWGVEFKGKVEDEEKDKVEAEIEDKGII